MGEEVCRLCKVVEGGFDLSVETVEGVVGNAGVVDDAGGAYLGILSGIALAETDRRKVGGAYRSIAL